MTRYTSSIDPGAIRALDVHVHVEVGRDGRRSLPDDLADAASAHFASGAGTPGIDEIAQCYRERDMAAIVFSLDAVAQLDHEPIDQDEIVDGAIRHSDVLIPFGSVDPARPDAIDRVRRLAEVRGVRGFKFHPTVQGFDPSDRRHYPLYEAISSAGAVALFHTGQTGIGAGLPGGRGLRLGLSDPMLLDVVAADFPHLQIVMAHPSVPWQDEALAVATHKPNVWIDLSGWSPKYFPDQLVRYANTLLKDRVLFGSDFPLITPDRWLRDAAGTALRDDVMPGILKGNALRLLGSAG